MGTLLFRCIVDDRFELLNMLLGEIQNAFLAHLRQFLVWIFRKSLCGNARFGEEAKSVVPNLLGGSATRVDFWAWANMIRSVTLGLGNGSPCVRTDQEVWLLSIRPGRA